MAAIPKLPDVRPDKLAHGVRRCGECTYFTSYNQTFRGSCQEVWEVKPRTRACVAFTLSLAPVRYRKDKAVQQYNNAAKSSQVSDLDGILEELGKLSRMGVFAHIKQVHGKMKVGTPVADALEAGFVDTEVLIPFYERVQQVRDTATAFLTDAQRSSTSLSRLWGQAEAYLYVTYSELREVKPESVRSALLDTILSEIDAKQMIAQTAIDSCEGILRNCREARESLVAIQSALRDPTTAGEGRIRGASRVIPRRYDT